MKAIKINEPTVFVISETVRVIITRSGWEGEFHCITEDGEQASVSYTLLSVNQIKKIYGDDAADLVNGVAENYSKQNILKTDNNDEGTLN